MRVVPYKPSRLDACAAFWWEIYRSMPYVHRPDGYQTVNSAPIGPVYFAKHLGYGLSGGAMQHWHGQVTDDSILLAEHDGSLCGLLVSAIDSDKSTSSILSAYVQRTPAGREAANALVEGIIRHSCRIGLHRCVAAPGTCSLEVESPVHLSLLDAGFAFNQIYANECYGVFLGGSLEGYQLPCEIGVRCEQLRTQGISIERCERDRLPIRRLDTGAEINVEKESGCVIVARVDGRAVGWTFEILVFEDEGRKLSMVGPEVIPSYRHRGIGKVVHHLGTEEAVRRGAQGGWTATGLQNPARFIYRSVGYQYWYTAYSDLSRRVR